MAVEGADKENFEPLEQYDHSLLRHPDRKDAGMMLAGGVLAVGDIQGQSTLMEARAIEKVHSIVLWSTEGTFPFCPAPQETGHEACLLRCGGKRC